MCTVQVSVKVNEGYAAMVLRCANANAKTGRGPKAWGEEVPG